MSSSRYKINPLVLLGVPTLEPRPLSWQWMDWYMSLEFGLGVGMMRSRIQGRTVADARNEICSQALNAKADYVLFISDDVLAPPNTFELLRRHRQHLVTGVYWTKGHPTQPYLYQGLNRGPYTDWTMGEFFPIDWAGCDCLLIHTDVLRAMEPPWFSHEWSYTPGSRPIPLATEDLYFYTKAKLAGHQLYCDSAVQCDHQDRATGTRFGLTAEMPQYARSIGQAVVDPGHIRVADLGCGNDTPWFGEQAEVVRFDGDPTCKPDVRCDLRAIPVPGGSFDIVHARHVLEHFMHTEAPVVVREWARLLKPGGELRIVVPNLACAAAEILKADADPNYDASLYPLWQVYGRQDGSIGEVHRNGFTRHGLARLLALLGLTDITVEVTGEMRENLTGRATKPAMVEPYSIADKWLPPVDEPSEEPSSEVTDLADIPVPPIPAEQLNGARELIAAGAGRTRASED